MLRMLTWCLFVCVGGAQLPCHAKVPLQPPQPGEHGQPWQPRHFPLDQAHPPRPDRAVQEQPEQAQPRGGTHGLFWRGVPRHQRHSRVLQGGGRRAPGAADEGRRAERKGRRHRRRVSSRVYDRKPYAAAAGPRHVSVPAPVSRGVTGPAANAATERQLPLVLGLSFNFKSAQPHGLSRPLHFMACIAAHCTLLEPK